VCNPGTCRERYPSAHVLWRNYGSGQFFVRLLGGRWVQGSFRSIGVHRSACGTFGSASCTVFSPPGHLPHGPPAAGTDVEPICRSGDLAMWLSNFPFYGVSPSPLPSFFPLSVFMHGSPIRGTALVRALPGKRLLRRQVTILFRYDFGNRQRPSAPVTLGVIPYDASRSARRQGSSAFLAFDRDLCPGGIASSPFGSQPPRRCSFRGRRRARYARGSPFLYRPRFYVPEIESLPFPFAVVWIALDLTQSEARISPSSWRVPSADPGVASGRAIALT